MPKVRRKETVGYATPFRTSTVTEVIKENCAFSHYNFFEIPSSHCSPSFVTGAPNGTANRYYCRTENKTNRANVSRSRRPFKNIHAKKKKKR